MFSSLSEIKLKNESGFNDKIKSLIKDDLDLVKNDLNEALVSQEKQFDLKTEYLSSKNKNNHKQLYQQYIKDLNNISSYRSPLGFFSIPKDVKVSLYYRIYKQMPLIMCIRLSVFRWIADMVKKRLNISTNLCFWGH